MHWYKLIDVDSECSTSSVDLPSESIRLDIVSLPFLKVSQISPKLRCVQKRESHNAIASESLDIESRSNDEMKTTSERGPLELSAVSYSGYMNRLGVLLRRCFYDAQVSMHMYIEFIL
jgi:hypothetical protein